MLEQKHPANGNGTAIHSSHFRKELEYIAFTGQYELVHAMMQRISPEERLEYGNKYIFSQTVKGGILKMRRLLAAQAEEAANAEKAFIDEVMDHFLNHCQETNSFTREFYETVLWWGEELEKLSLPEEALSWLEIAMDNGVNRFPEFQLQMMSRMASINGKKGEIQKAYQVLSDIASRPYMISDRNLIPEILFNLSQAALHLGNIFYYKKLLFLGLNLFYTDIESRKQFLLQLLSTYRRSYKVLLSRDIPLKNRLNFLFHKIYFLLPDFSKVKLGWLKQLYRKGLLGYVYLLNYTRPETHIDSKEESVRFHLPALHTGNGKPFPGGNGKHSKKREHILITRAMGGIGDLLMMTPGIHTLKKKYPHKEIHLAIPKRYFPVFENNPDVVLLDIENDVINYPGYRKWFNFTDCPAARVETRTAPRVRKTRIEIFAEALGIGKWRLKRNGLLPRYFLTPVEKDFQQQFFHSHHLSDKKVIGVQLKADETYRDYPHMEALVKLLSTKYTVLVFDAQPIEGFDFPNVIKIDSYSLREAFAIAAGCDAIIAPDSAFVHFSAAMNIPCIALFGPIDGKVRTKFYPLCTFLDARKRLGCISCWRNELIPCKLTNMRPSVCMGDIHLEEIIAALKNIFKQHGSEKDFYNNNKVIHELQNKDSFTLSTVDTRNELLINKIPNSTS
ncbi:MAG: hypothetical protein D6748_09430 [Calditrichaeota bacterium]|nr:MAG: hypothetical protein D6748_09430 [Calditrichota bacterium]